MSQFWADILDANDNIVGDGPLEHLTRLVDTARLDVIGEAEFETPAADPRTAQVQAGRKFDLYDQVDGYIGRFLYKSKRVQERQGQAVLAVQCYDALRELSQETVAFRRTYVNQAVDTVVDSLVALVSGWSSNADPGIGNTTISYEGESVLISIDALRDRWGQHFRLLTPKTLEFGAFGSASGVRLTNLSGQVQEEIAERTEVAIVENISLVEEADEIFNRVIPLGAGQGVSQLTIEQATLGSYTVQNASNQDGSLYYFIEDAASVAAYGQRSKILSFPNIRPITNSDANIINAANALKLTAEAYIARHLSPRMTYQVSVRGLRSVIRPGDTVRLTYRGVVDNYVYIDVDDDFYLMDVTRSRDASGERTANLTIATTAERRTADSDVMIDVVRDIGALKVHVPITLAYSPIGPYSRGLGPSHPAQFTARIADETTFLNYAILRFKTAPLRSNVAGAASGGGTVGSTESGGSGTPTSQSGGGGTPTSESGGGGTPTSGSSSSSTTGSNQHFHTVGISGAGSGQQVLFDGSSLRVSGTGGTFETFQESPHAHGMQHTHDVSIPSHTHDVTIPNHTHDVTIPSHDHDVTIPNHTHDLQYGFFDDTDYPQTISLEINGVDVTSALGGPWAPSNAPVEIEKDITSYLANAVGGLRQNHTIEFSCSGGQGEIECEVDMLVSIQPIAIS